MSSRQLRKIRQQQELQGAAKPEDDEASESEEEAPVAKPRASLFAALGGEDEDEDEDEQDEAVDPVAERDDKPAVEQAQPAAAKKKRKKKKGKKNQGAGKAPQPSAPDEDDIDKALKELNIQPRASPNGSSPGAEQTGSSVLAINPYHLKAIHEMKALFGREVIESARAEEEAEDQAARRRLLLGGARQVDLETFLKGDIGRKLPEVTLRRNMFIQGKDNWPRAAAGGLIMRELETDEDTGVTEYAFVHEKQYDVVQSIFFHCVGIGDPMRMVHLLKQFPYHVSTLLQVSAFAKQDQNQALAADLCERALFSFGRVTLSSFRQKLERGQARLDFRRPENRQFWLAGYHYLKSLMRKGTYRTALEWAKLMFGLDPETDPYGINHLIHILAVRGREVEWLESFVAAFKDGPLHGELRYYRNSLILGWIQQQEDDKAKARLVEEMETTPWLYCALFQSLGIDAPPSIWGVQPPGEVDAFYTTLYLEMTKDLWNFPRYTSLLKAAADAAKKQRDAEPTQAVLELRTARFVYLESNTKMMGLVPRHYLDRQPNYEFDPLPPDKASNIFTGNGTKLPFEERTEDDGARAWMRALEARGQRAGPGAVQEEGVEEIPDEVADELRDAIYGAAGSGSEFEDDEPGLEGVEGLEDTPSVQQSIYDTLMDIFGRRNARRDEGRGEGAEPATLPGAWPGEESGEERGAE